MPTENRSLLVRALSPIWRRAGWLTPRESRLQFETQLLSAARGVAASGRHRVIDPTKVGLAGTKLRIGFVGNLANNAYGFVRSLRRLGHDAELVVEDGGLDAFVMNRPFWEELEVECRSYEEGARHEMRWKSPPFVKHAQYDEALGARFAGRWRAVPEVQALYKEAFGIELPSDRALLLAQRMSHWPLLLAMKDYDVIQLSSGAISLGPFCPKPYVVFPTGGDLFSSPFEETFPGFLMRAGYLGADHVLLCETNYPGYLDRLSNTRLRSYSPLMLDTVVNAPGDAESLRAKWRAATGGSRFAVGICRQAWDWKGSDRMLHGFARFARTEAGKRWRLVLLEWGSDVTKSKALVKELSLEAEVIWEPLCSKPTLRERQRAADVVVDQFVMEGYGTSVLESLAAGKPVIMAPQPLEAAASLIGEPPPFSGATSAEEIADALARLDDDAVRNAQGEASLAWVRKHHGPESTAPKYLAAYRAALGQAPQPGELGDAEATLTQMTELHQRLRIRMRERFDRSVPLADEVTDRWERARFLGFGEGASIYDSAVVFGNVAVGAKTWIGPGCVLDGSGGLEIGAACSIATGVHLYSHDTVDWAVSGGVAPYKRAATSIGDACYIGPQSVITAGTRIGKRCIVGALSMVKGTIPDHSFVAGVPARILGKVEVDGETVRIVYDKREMTSG